MTKTPVTSHQRKPKHQPRRLASFVEAHQKPKEKETMKKIATIFFTAALLLGSAACSTSDASVASHNLSKAADQFEIQRRIIFFNGITDTYLMTIEGRCSIAADGIDSQLEVTCKVGPEEYKKHFLGLSDNVSYFVEQTEAAKVSVYRYRVIFKPESILPNVDLSSSVTDKQDEPG